MRIVMILVMAVLATPSAMADSVEEMCRDWQKPDKVCKCAAEQLKSQVGDDDYALYDSIGADYIANKAKGMNMGGAWDDAVRKDSVNRGASFVSTLQRTNRLGKIHNKAIKGCAG